MKKVWIFLGFLAVFGTVCYADESKYSYDDYWYDDEVDKLGIKQDYPDDIPVNNEEDKDIEDKELKNLSLELEQEVNDFSKGMSDLNQNENSERINEDIDDYQIEDNRSEVKEKEDVSAEFEYPLEEGLELSSWENEKSLEVQDEKPDEIEEEQLNDYDNFDMKKDDENDEAFEGEDIDVDESKNVDVNIRPLQGFVDFDDKQKDEGAKDEAIDETDESQRKIAEETSKLLNEDQENDFADIKSDNFEEEQDEDLKNTADETKSILEEDEDTDQEFDKEEIEDQEIPIPDDDKNSEKDSVKINADSHDDDQGSHIDSIMEETRQILNETSEVFDEKEHVEDTKDSNEDNDEGSENEFNISEDDDEDEAESSLEIAYKDLQDDLETLSATWNKLRKEINDDKENEEQLSSDEDINSRLSEIENSALENDYENIDDDNISKIFEDQLGELNDESEMDEAESSNEKEEEIQQPEANEIKEENRQIPNQSPEKVTEKLIPYVDDALVANEVSETSAKNIESSTTKVEEHKVEPLEMSSSEFKNLIDDVLLDPVQDSKIQDVQPSTEQKRITLSVTEPVAVTSPNYPSPYPTNAITEWILEGDGMGIEFNVTDFAVNGHNGDHVLVKPGQIDGSGSDGLIFTYMLRKERYYRFMDVNRMFIRFQTNPGMSWQRGFSFSVKLIYPLRSSIVEEPEPEIPDIGYPESTLTINLGGVTLEGFLAVKEDFRRIVADMATVYIQTNGIDPGRNTTLEVTQITSTALCFHNWPKFEQCAEVRFGVPLQYSDEEADPRLNEEDLRDMWWTYSQRDPFALRLRRLNITEFQIPDDGNILMVWLVIAAGVVISMAMLAFALWRFSCFEDYSRMPAFSDTESINEKKTLDLYPTPHQTLPSLYSETDYKWGEDKFAEAARADMGGFANRSYVRTDDYDFDSDEEVVVARDRDARIRPRDIYNV